jgi:hypothetical protein
LERLRVRSERPSASSGRQPDGSHIAELQDQIDRPTIKCDPAAPALALRAYLPVRRVWARLSPMQHTQYPPQSSDSAITVALAEFQALRAEMVSRTSSQATLIGVGFTAMGVIVGFTVKDGGDVRLLLALPLVALVVNLLWSIESRRVTLSGAYIRESLWPRLERWVGRELPSWEADVDTRRRGRAVLASLITDGAALLMFAAAAAIGIVVAASRRPVDEKLVIADSVIVALSVVVPAGFALTNRRYSGAGGDPAPFSVEPAQSRDRESDTPQP